MDLLQSIRNVFNDQVTNQLGSALGVDASTATQAIQKALPAVVAGLVRQGSTPGGATNLFHALDKVDPGLLNGLGSSLTGGNLQSWIDMGTKYLPLIFGSNYSAIFGTLGKLTGLGSGKIGPLLSMIAPIVMAILSKAKSSGQLTQNGFTQLLADQKNLLPSLDPQIADQFGLGAMATTAKQTVESFGTTVQKSREFAASTAGSAGPSIGKWLIPILALAAVALVLYVYVFSPDRGEVVTPKVGSEAQQGTANMPSVGAGPPASKQAAASEAERMEKAAESNEEKPSEGDKAEGAAGLDLIKPLTSFVTEASGMFAEIKDEASAQSTAQKLQDLAGKVEGLSLDKLAGPAKVIAAREVNKLLDQIKEWAEKSYKVPGVQTILEPAVNAVVDKLKAAIG